MSIVVINKDFDLSNCPRKPGVKIDDIVYIDGNYINLAKRDCEKYGLTEIADQYVIEPMIQCVNRYGYGPYKVVRMELTVDHAPWWINIVPINKKTGNVLKVTPEVVNSKIFRQAPTYEPRKLIRESSENKYWNYKYPYIMIRIETVEDAIKLRKIIHNTNLSFLYDNCSDQLDSLIDDFHSKPHEGPFYFKIKKHHSIFDTPFEGTRGSIYYAESDEYREDYGEYEKFFTIKEMDFGGLGNIIRIGSLVPSYQPRQMIRD